MEYAEVDAEDYEEEDDEEADDEEDEEEGDESPQQEEFHEVRAVSFCSQIQNICPPVKNHLSPGFEIAHCQHRIQWSLTYPDTSIPKLTVRISETLSI